jgi:predicted amidophosphoribosyltransferase
MAIINCPECGSTVSDKAEKCPKCSYPIQSNTKPREGLFLQSLNFGCMFILVTVGAIILFSILATMFS